MTIIYSKRKFKFMDNIIYLWQNKSFKSDRNYKGKSILSPLTDDLTSTLSDIFCNNILF